VPKSSFGGLPWHVYQPFCEESRFQIITAIDSAGDFLEGDWLLLGGALLPAVGVDVRSTVDVDLVCLKRGGAEQTLRLMKLAESLGSPIESVNQAAAHFLDKTGYSRKDLIELSRGKTAVLFRPSVRLYWKLKIPRLTESDLSDCQHYFRFCRGNGDDINGEELRDLVRTELARKPPPEKSRRLKALLSVLA
jgi:hypothetical protein